MMRRVLSLTLAVLVTIGVPAWATRGFRVATTEQARRRQVEEQPVQLSALALQNPSGGRVSLADPQRITIVDLIYTRCRTLCVQLSASFQGLQHEITKRGLDDRVRLLTITFDPAADSLPALADFAERHRVNAAIWEVARPGDATELLALQRALGIKVLADGDDGFVHNAALHLIDAKGRLIAIVPSDAPMLALERAVAAQRSAAVMRLAAVR